MLLFKEIEKEVYKLHLKFSNKIIEKPLDTVIVPVNLINMRIGTQQSKIKSITNKNISIMGVILDGNWDLKKKNIEEISLFSALKERFIEGKEWEETVYYDLFSKYKGTDNGIIKGSVTWEDLKINHLKRWDDLYLDIKKNGYKSQDIIGKNNQSEIIVCISRNGEILHGGNGNHRIVIAKLLNLTEVPVNVRAWHKEYIDSVKNNLDCKGILTPKRAIKPIITNYENNNKLNI